MEGCRSGGSSFFNDFLFHEFSQITRIRLCRSLCYSFGNFVVERTWRMKDMIRDQVIWYHPTITSSRLPIPNSLRFFPKKFCAPLSLSTSVFKCENWKIRSHGSLYFLLIFHAFIFSFFWSQVHNSWLPTNASRLTPSKICAYPFNQ